MSGVLVGAAIAISVPAAILLVGVALHHARSRDLLGSVPGSAGRSRRS